jgi:hypothetical protein
VADAKIPEQPRQEEAKVQQDLADHARTEELQGHPDRRRVIIGGLITAPVILTLKSRALRAQTTTASAAASVTPSATP